jgi:hypothetical protein
LSQLALAGRATLPGARGLGILRQREDQPRQAAPALANPLLAVGVPSPVHPQGGPAGDAAIDLLLLAGRTGGNVTPSSITLVTPSSRTTSGWSRARLHSS